MTLKQKLSDDPVKLPERTLTHLRNRVSEMAQAEPCVDHLWILKLLEVSESKTDDLVSIISTYAESLSSRISERVEKERRKAKAIRAAKSN